MLLGRSTHDYSPLRGPITNPHTGRDLRGRKERQEYEQAVNARSEMLGWIASKPQHKFTKRERELLGRAVTKGYM